VVLDSTGTITATLSFGESASNSSLLDRTFLNIKSSPHRFISPMFSVQLPGNEDRILANVYGILQLDMIISASGIVISIKILKTALQPRVL